MKETEIFSLEIYLCDNPPRNKKLTTRTRYLYHNSVVLEQDLSNTLTNHNQTWLEARANPTTPRPQRPHNSSLPSSPWKRRDGKASNSSYGTRKRQSLWGELPVRGVSLQIKHEWGHSLLLQLEQYTFPAFRYC